jgi:hypothetical protein
VLSNLKSRLVSIEEYYNKMFVITTDHGHTASAADGEREAWAEENWQAGGPALDPTNHHMHLDEFVAAMRVIGRASSPRREFSILHPRTEDDPGARDPQTRDVVVAFNGPMAHVYVRSRDTNGDLMPWDVPACEADRDAVGNGLAAALGGVSGVGFGTSEDLRTDAALFELEPGVKPLQTLIDAVDFVLVRKGDTYVVRKAVPDGSPSNSPPAAAPEVPQCGGAVAVPTEVREFSLSEFDQVFNQGLSFEGRGHYVDLARRVEDLNHQQRAGDVIIVFKFRTDDLRESRYSSGGNLPSWHGSLNRSDSYVPFIVSYPGGNAEQMKQFVEPVCGPGATHCESTLKVAPLIKGIIGGQMEGATEEQEQGP